MDGSRVAALTAQGPDACPRRGRIATGPAMVWIGAGEPLSANANVFATGRKGIVLVLDVGAGALAVLRGRSPVHASSCPSRRGRSRRASGRHSSGST
ncbi:MAG TPA: hypothetical protein VE270_12100 [Thermoleophilaceae bacterium]|nr:hypothetical protein [Thermoleophilaceae bacterium]